MLSLNQKNYLQNMLVDLREIQTALSACGIAYERIMTEDGAVHLTRLSFDILMQLRKEYPSG